MFGIKLVWSILGVWKEKRRKVYLYFMGDGGCLILGAWSFYFCRFLVDIF